MLVPHIALRFECRIYSYGALSTTIRKALGWMHNDQEELVPPQIVGAEEEGEFVRLKRKSWARLIKKLYLDDPTLCPACRQPMRIISVITHPHQDDVIEKILRSRGQWDPPWHRERRARGPPRSQHACTATESCTQIWSEEDFNQVPPEDPWDS